ncbi:hypothetical protein [Mycolicibacterium mageritense]|uniref:Uncharacterized protein n=1 Tax=Mycolicibacterium mageritense TaxID=53462 RepID=A0AAI8TYP6_MYCME|nr:hypothetical protein [Mycolicibacterium mageritense]BDY31439.1 hypothetical protein hbim_05391 [Mycolicibacterium mageritense]
MLDDTLVLMVGYLLPLVAAWVGVIWMRPMVARARVQRKAEAVHDDLMDAIFRGDIRVDNARAVDALAYSEFLTKSAQKLCISAVVATEMAAERVGFDMNAEVKKRNDATMLASRNKANAAGAAVLDEAERELDRAVAWYFVRGTILWPLLVPMQTAVRFLRKQKSATAEQISLTIDQPRPEERATELRESARGARSPLPEFMSHFQPKADSDLVLA